MAEAVTITDLVTSYIGDAVDVLKSLPAESVQCCVTSPPYFGLRSYLPKEHPDKTKEVGLQKSPEEYIDSLVQVFREVRRVLRSDGCLWLNLGDSYNADGRKGRKHMGEGKNEGYSAWCNKTRFDTKPKDLMLIPHRTAIALQEDGWWLRSGVPWVKRNAMPESVEDRPGSSLEYVFLLTKSPDYFYDREAVKRPPSSATLKDKRIGTERTGDYQQAESDYGGTNSRSRTKARNATGDKTGRNRRNGDWWFESVGAFHHTETGELMGFDVVPKPYKGAHFACFPPDLIRPMLQSSTSSVGCCSSCGSPHRRMVNKERVPTRPATYSKVTGDADTDGNRDPLRHVTHTTTVGWEAGCGCGVDRIVPSTVLDPFGGSGTTGMVCQEMGLKCILIDLNPDYLKLQQERVALAVT